MSDYFQAERQGYFFGFGRSLTRTVKILLLVNVFGFFMQLGLENSTSLVQILGMTPARFLGQWALWQPLTGLLLHPNLWNLLMDLLVLWFFAPEVEFALGGGRQLAAFYVTCGVLSNLVAAFLAPESLMPILGPGGAIFGILTAFATLFPQRIITLLLFFVIPVQMKAKYLIFIFGLIEWFSLMEGQFGDISRYATLAGIPVGFVLVRNRRILEGLTAGELLSFFRRKALSSSREKENYIRRKIDPILEKIAKQGLHSLSWREKRILRHAKTRVKPK